MLGNFRNRDTLEIFNERWKTNHFKFKKNKLNNINSPSDIAKMVTGNINRINKYQNSNLFNKKNNF